MYKLEIGTEVSIGKDKIHTPMDIFGYKTKSEWVVIEENEDHLKWRRIK